MRINRKIIRNCVVISVLLLVFTQILEFNFFSLSPSGLLYRVNFYSQNGRTMTEGENIMYARYGNPRLADAGYCKQIGGVTPDAYEWPKVSAYLGTYRFKDCLPPSNDGGKICYDDRECQSYCDVESMDATYGKCHGYLNDRNLMCHPYFYFVNGKVEKNRWGWCD
jgi:hypothetical protein